MYKRQNFCNLVGAYKKNKLVRRHCQNYYRKKGVEYTPLNISSWHFRHWVSKVSTQEKIYPIETV